MAPPVNDEAFPSLGSAPQQRRGGGGGRRGKGQKMDLASFNQKAGGYSVGNRETDMLARLPRHATGIEHLSLIHI